MKYRKKPIVIEAWHVGTNAMPSWLRDAIDKEVVIVDDHFDYSIVTLEGIMNASLGDYIIQGVKGELYPCKPDIFEATYDQVEP